MKRYTIRCPYCGSEKEMFEWILRLFFIPYDRFTFNCPVCHHKSVWLTHFVLKHDTINKDEQKFNKMKLWDDRIE